MKYTHIFIVGILFLLPAVTWAETVVRTGDSVSIENNQTVENDLYAAARVVSVSGTVAEDMYAAAGSVTVNGSVGSDLTVLAGTAQIHASTSDDVRVVAGETVIGDHVGGDVFVIGGLLKVLSSASIDGNIFFYGGDVEVSGPVRGSVMGTAETVRIDSAIGGSVDMNVARSLTLGDRASVGENVRYQSPNELVRAQNAVVEGEVQHAERQTTTESGGFSLSLVFAYVFAVLTTLLVFRKELVALVALILEHSAKTVLVGFATLVGAPVVAILLMVTVLGGFLGTVLLSSVLTLFLVSMVVMSVVAGALVAYALSKKGTVNLLYVLVGALLVLLLTALPLVGPFVLLLLFTLTLGGIVLALYQLIS